MTEAFELSVHLIHTPIGTVMVLGILENCLPAHLPPPSLKLFQHRHHRLCKRTHLCKPYSTSGGLAHGSLLEMLNE